jgi:hypothetical protein
VIDIVLKCIESNHYAQVDLILSIDSMLRIAKLVIISGKPWVIFAGCTWLFVNIVCTYHSNPQLPTDSL